ncbi:MAG: hypothetical protein HUJ97_00315 [Bacteroidales bacterium]|nr:hypothetical protein [Bacteroidales bacterium]
MKLRCTNIIKDYSHIFEKGKIYQSGAMANDSCMIAGDHPHKSHITWQGVKTVLGVTVLGIATFTIIEE